MRRLSVFLLLTALSMPLLARQTVGLVLGGGGARGAAHIGVLEVLEELHVPVDCIAGTSMGALVAGAFAAGMTPQQMREAMAKADWADMFLDNPDYSEMSYRNKLLSREFVPGSETGVSADGVRYQGGVVSGQKIKLFFNQLVRSDLGERNIEKLPIPLSIIATDIGSGARVVFRDGSLTKSMRASMSVPGLMAPVDYRNLKLVDGGLVDNLPVEEARNRCHPDVIIAINVGSPLLKPESIGSLLSVSTQMVNILTEQNVTHSLTQLRETDIYIRPELDEISAGDFQKNGQAADRGRTAAQDFRDRLRLLSVSKEEYERWWRRVEIARFAPPQIDGIEIDGLKAVNPTALMRYLEQQPGTPIATETLNRDLLRAYGDGYYEGIDYEVVARRNRNILRILPVEKPWGPDYLRVGVYMRSTLKRGSTYGIRGAYHRTWLNSLGGEFMATGELGTTDALHVDWFQPVEDGQIAFVEPEFAYRRKYLDVYQRDKRIAQLRLTESRLDLMGGITFGHVGQIRAGWEGQRHHAAVDIGMPGLPPDDDTYGGWKIALDLDQRNRLFSTTHGWSLRSSYFDSTKAGYSKLEGELQGTTAFDEYVITGRYRYSGSPRGRVPYYDAASLGGFLNLSGFGQDQILGDNIRYAGVQVERIVGRLPLGLRGDMRLGLALEAGKAGVRYTETERNGWLNSAAVYLGGETPLGMLYVGVGRSSAGPTNVYLFIGTP